MQRAQEYKLQNWRQKTPEQLRYLIVDYLAKEYREENKRQQADLIKRQALLRMSNVVSAEKNE
jgi:hypothetical protein